MADQPTVERAEYAREYGEMVGEGSSRRVFWDGTSRWAYKFIINDDPWNNKKANREEFDNYLKLSDADLGIIKLPEMQLLNNGVMAIEYIKGSHPSNDCYSGQHDFGCGDSPDCWYNKTNARHYESNVKGFRDISWANVIVAESGDIYAIDLEY